MGFWEWVLIPCCPGCVPGVRSHRGRRSPYKAETGPEGPVSHPATEAAGGISAEIIPRAPVFSMRPRLLSPRCGVTSRVRRSKTTSYYHVYYHVSWDITTLVCARGQPHSSGSEADLESD